MNPFDQKPKKLESLIMSFKDLSVTPYNKFEIDPYTRVRCILMNGTEYEAVWFGHHFSRHCNDNDVKRTIALVRRMEQQQQKLISALKPIDENLLETTIGYEQLAVDLTAFLAQNEKNEDVVKALNFALLEDFDHLYRYSNMLETDMGEHAETFVGSYTEIMPARPTIAHHRHPYDTIKPHIDNKVADPFSKLNVQIITAAEQQTMNYYMNLGSFYKTQKGRNLYTEIGMVEEDHVTQYGSLIDPTPSLFECCLLHEYTECYLYFSMLNDETDPHIKQIWEMLFEQELAHLHSSAKLLKKYEKKDWQEVIPNGEFPKLIKFHENKEYIRSVIDRTITLTGDRESYIDIKNVPCDANFFKYQNKLNKKPETDAGHIVICDHIRSFSEDYRVQDKEHPIKELRNRTKDNITIGRVNNKCKK